jgi:hypothetical protein
MPVGLPRRQRHVSRTAVRQDTVCVQDTQGLV